MPDISYCHNSRWVEAWDAAKSPARHRAATLIPNKVSIQKVNSATSKKQGCRPSWMKAWTILGRRVQNCSVKMVASSLENPMDRGAWWAAVHGVAKSRTRLSNFTFTFHFHALEEGHGNPLQCSCLENPRDGRAWWAATYGAAKSRTRPK